MNKKSTFIFLTFIAFGHLVSCNCPSSPPAHPPTNPADSGSQGGPTVTPSSIVYGVPLDGCAGKGICKGTGSLELPPDDPAINVGWSVSASGMLNLTFLRSKLHDKQPGQDGNFANGGTYNFDYPYSLEQDFLAGLNLPPHSILSANPNQSPATVAIVADTITLTIKPFIWHTSTVNVVFGGKGLVGGSYSQSVKGIWAVSAAPIPANGNIPASVPVRFSISTDARQIIFAVNKDLLIATEPTAGNVMNTAAGSATHDYKFANAFTFNDPVFLPVGIPQTAKATGVTVSKVNLIGTDLVDTITYTIH